MLVLSEQHLNSSIKLAYDSTHQGLVVKNGFKGWSTCKRKKANAGGCKGRQISLGVLSKEQSSGLDAHNNVVIFVLMGIDGVIHQCPANTVGIQGDNLPV